MSLCVDAMVDLPKHRSSNFQSLMDNKLCLQTLFLQKLFLLDDLYGCRLFRALIIKDVLGKNLIKGFENHKLV